MVRTAVLLSMIVAPGLAQDCPSGRIADALGRVQRLGQAAQQAFQHGDYAEAARNFRQAICFVPDKAELYHGLGLAEAAGGHFDRAGKALEQADRLSPHTFSILLPRSQVAASAGDIALANRMLRQAERLADAESPVGRVTLGQVHAQLGAALLQKRQLDPALAQLLRAQQAGVRDPAILLMLATLENNMGAYGDAIRDCAGVDGSPDATVEQRGTAAAVAALAYRNQKKNEEAIQFLKHAIEISPVETAYLALADIYDMEEKAADAAKLLEQGRSALPASQKIAVALGKSLVTAGENQRAAAILSEITQNYPADAEAWRWLAQAESSLGEFSKATEALQQLARRQPDYPMIDMMMAQSLLKWEQPDYERALLLLDRAARAAPGDPDVPYLQGRIYFSMGRYADAVGALARAIELGPTIPAPRYQLGQALQKLGREAEAKEQFEKMKYLKNDAP